MPRSDMDMYRIFGTERALSIPDMLMWSYDEGKKSWEHRIKKRHVNVEDKEVTPFNRQFEHFAKVARGLDQPRCSGDEGLRALIVYEVIRKALEGSDQGGTVDSGDLSSGL